MEIGDLEIRQFISFLRSVSEYDFTNYSDKSLKRRLAKILVDSKLDLQSLIRKMKSNPAFLEQVVKDITVNTTELFRDPQIWNALRYDILPCFADQKRINIWHAGCSTGQEVYSMLILLNELELFDKSYIYATDINSDVLSIARQGIYKYHYNTNYLDNFEKVINENPQDYDTYRDIAYDKYFDIDKPSDIIKMKSFLSDKPVYKKMDLAIDENPFPVNYDLIMCRNVIIYFNFNLQNKVIKLFYDSLYNKGCLVLGVHESILGAYATFFEKKHKVYFKK